MSSTRAPAIAGSAVFLLAYLAVSFTGPLADRSLPLPDAPAADVAAYYSANPVATVVVTVLQVVSVLGFAVFARAVGNRAVAAVSVLAMVVSSVLSVVLAIVAGSASLGAVQALRLGSFYAGGVVNVVTLGVFVFLAAKAFASAPTRWFGYVAGALAMLSVLSLAFYYASAFLPVGRVLSMVWTVVAAIVLTRNRAVTGSPR